MSLAPTICSANMILLFLNGSMLIDYRYILINQLFAHLKRSRDFECFHLFGVG
jgi:hypothetical protein